MHVLCSVRVLPDPRENVSHKHGLLGGFGKLKEGICAMKTIGKSLAFAGLLAIGFLGFGAVPARAQGFSLGYSSPGFSVGVNTGGYGYYGGGVYPGYPIVAPAPIVVAPRVPYVVPGPIYGPRPFFRPPVVYGPRVYGGPYRYGYGRRGW